MDELMQLREQIHSQHAFQNMVSKNPRMHAVFELINNRRPDHDDGADRGRDGHGQGAGGPGDPPVVRPAPQGRAGGGQLRRAAETLLESELFGPREGRLHRRVGHRQGRFELADGGTIFLDEVATSPADAGQTPPRAPGAALRAGRRPRNIEVDVRVIAATNRSLRGLVKQGGSARTCTIVNWLKIDLPPLRERRRTCRCWRRYFAARYARTGEPPKAITRRRWSGCWRTAGGQHPRAGERLERAWSRRAARSSSRATCRRRWRIDGDGRAVVDLNRPLSDLLRETTQQMEKLYLRKALSKSAATSAAPPRFAPVAAQHLREAGRVSHR